MKTVLIINAFCSRKVFESVERLWQDLGYKILDQNFNELLKYLMPSKMVNDNECTFLTLKIPRLANWQEFARLTQGNILAPVFPPAFWTKNGGFNHSDDM